VERRRFPVVIAIAFGIVACELLRTAWVSDDAYITFRTADNVIHGFGPVWNTTERVQGFTHPLWLAVYTAVYAITREAYYTCIALGAALTLVAVAMLHRIQRTQWSFVAAMAVLVSSKAFVDFSTSGLENPLSHVLALLFLWCWWRYEGNDRILKLTLVASLCVLNRIDFAILVGPALAVAIVRAGPLMVWRSVALGISPVIAWELFSVLYYASPAPNTAYAKLNIALDLRGAIQRGYWYAMRTATADPVTLPAMLVAVFLTVRDSWRRNWPLLAGLFASHAYVFWIGGDFMLGRFYSVPLVWSAGMIAASPIVATRRIALPLSSAIVVLGLLAPWEPALLSGVGYTPFDNWLHERSERGPRDNGLLITQFEITDTRRYYFEGNGLLKGRLGDRRPDNPGVDDGLELRAGGRQVVTRYAIGFTGYFAGPDVHIVDVLALTDPLLARLPSVPGARVGHYQRDIPAGYLESLQANGNLIADPDLAEYYGHLRFAVSGPVFDLRRAATAIGLALGRHDATLQRYIDKTWPGR
jgi:arabinofuranosyltransferase